MIPHPYNPPSLLIPHYRPNDLPNFQIQLIFFAFLAVCLLVLWLYMRGVPHLASSLLLRSKLAWFLACGLIHFILEGYFAVFHRTLAGRQDLLAQMWKEYGKGDSRYVSGDTFMVCMESITAFVDGPLAFLAVYAFIRGRSYRFVVQLLLSVCQLYGDVLYFSTEIKDDCMHGEKWHPVYFWYYFVFMNLIWIVVPSLCIVESCRSLSAAQSTADDTSCASAKHNKRQ